MGFLTRMLGEKRSMGDSQMIGLLRAGLNGAITTAAGVTVTPESALQVTAVYACVRVLGESLASLPLILYRRQGEKAKSWATNHSLFSVLHDLPNPEMTSFELRETLMSHLALRGNAFGYKVYDNGGTLLELWPLRPDRMIVRRMADNTLEYIYTMPSGEQRHIHPDYIMHIRGLSYDGLIGYSPITLARQAVGLALGTEEYGARFFGNGARASTVLKHPGRLSDTAYDRLMKSWENRHQGLENAHRVAILEEGMAVEQVGMAPEDAQFLQTRKFQKEEIAGIYRIPPHMIASLDKATFGNIEHQSLEFVIHTMRPWLVRWEQCISRDLLSPSERKRYFAEFQVDALLRGDLQSRYAAYAVGRNWGWLSANDVRSAENMNPVEGGDVYLSPLNMIPAQDVGKEPAGGTGQGAGGQDAGGKGQGARSVDWRPLYLDVAARLVKREVSDIRRAMGKEWRKKSDTDFTRWLEGFYGEFMDVAAEGFRPLGQARHGEPGAHHGDAYRYCDLGLDELAKLISQGPDAFEARLDEWEVSRAETLASSMVGVNDEA